MSLDSSCDLLKVVLSDFTVIKIPSFLHNLYPLLANVVSHIQGFSTNSFIRRLPSYIRNSTIVSFLIYTYVDIIKIINSALWPNVEVDEKIAFVK